VSLAAGMAYTVPVIIQDHPRFHYYCLLNDRHPVSAGMQLAKSQCLRKSSIFSGHFNRQGI
jgi:hypothetical protein